MELQALNGLSCPLTDMVTIPEDAYLSLNAI